MPRSETKNSPTPERREWTALLLMGAIAFALPTIVRLIWSEPFPAVNFPAFAQPNTSDGEAAELWILTPDSEQPLIAERVRTGSRSMIIERLVAIGLESGLQDDHIRWLEQVDGNDPICRVEYRAPDQIDVLPLSHDADDRPSECDGQ